MRPVDRKRRCDTTAALGRPVVPDVNRNVALSPSLIRCVSGRFDVGASVASAPRSTAQFGARVLPASATNRKPLPSSSVRSAFTPATASVSSSPKIHALDCVTDDAMRQRSAAQVRVDQRCNRSEFGNRDECGQKLDAVLHHQADDVAVADTARFQRMSELVGQCVEFLPRDLPAFEQQHHPVAEFRRRSLRASARRNRACRPAAARDSADCAATRRTPSALKSTSRTPMQNPLRNGTATLSDRICNGKRIASVGTFRDAATSQRRSGAMNQWQIGDVKITRIVEIRSRRRHQVHPAARDTRGVSRRSSG